jgi:hypothetical protein
MFFEVLAAFGLAAGDVFAAVGLAGAAFLLIWALAGKRLRKAPELMWIWGFSGTILGLLCFGAILISGTPAERVGFVFGWPPSLVGGMLAVAVAMLGLSAALSIRSGAGAQRAIDRRKPTRSRQVK